jgi:hypothetical protein
MACKMSWHVALLVLVRFVSLGFIESALKLEQACFQHADLLFEIAWLEKVLCGTGKERRSFHAPPRLLEVSLANHRSGLHVEIPMARIKKADAEILVSGTFYGAGMILLLTEYKRKSEYT